jgi:hypothetical protein
MSGFFALCAVSSCACIFGTNKIRASVKNINAVFIVALLTLQDQSSLIFCLGNLALKVMFGRFLLPLNFIGVLLNAAR